MWEPGHGHAPADRALGQRSTANPVGDAQQLREATRWNVPVDP